MEQLNTPYGERLGRDCPLADYPRPQMVRGSCHILNGIWQYAVTQGGAPPAEWQGEILVPFPPESPLSGVSRVTEPGDTLWYRRFFELREDFIKGRVLLHFGAVDSMCAVALNGRQVGEHVGGYIPFCVDITDALAEGRQELVVSVTDPTDTAALPLGRQRLWHGGPWHTPHSGIWQTVWMESVPQCYIAGLRVTPLYDDGAVEITAETVGASPQGEVRVLAGRSPVAAGVLRGGEPLRLKLPGAISWAPLKPFLYTLRVRAGEDEVESYFGMRKISVEPGGGGRGRIMLNNRPFFTAGVLDQGMYCDGLYTPPSDAAMEGDLRFARACGFNAVRKHGKIEPLRWYYHCDRLGMLVWQDLPGAGAAPRTSRLERLLAGKKPKNDADYAKFGRQDGAGRQAFERQMEQAAELLQSCPSLVAWVLFQDGCGQFDAARLAARMGELSPGRLVDHASGRYDMGAGDINSPHLYGKEQWSAPPPDARAAVLTEAGGFGLLEPEHFAGAQPFAAHKAQNARELAQEVTALYRDVLCKLPSEGFSGFFLSQLSDAQDEVSGLLTADRRCEKLAARGVRRLNEIVLEAHDGMW